MTQGVCKIPTCPRPTRGHGWCQWHRDKWRRYGTPEPVCSLVDCDKPLAERGYCRRHADLQKNHGTPFYTSRLALEPLLAYFALHGGVSVAISAAGYQRGTQGYERLQKAVEHSRARGYVTAYTADTIAIQVFGVHPAFIYGDDWWIQFPANDEELIAS